MRTLQLERDIFFISKEFYDGNIETLRNVLVIPKKDFFDHSDYSNVVNVSNHATWKITFDYAIIAKEGWYESNNELFKKALLEESIKNGTMMVLNDELLTIKKWNGLDSEAKTKFIEQRDDPEYKTDLDAIEGLEHLKKFHNIFPNNHGANCFASVMYAVTNNEELINNWVFSDTLFLFLETYGYQKLTESDINLIESGDVLVIYSS